MKTINIKTAAIVGAIKEMNAGDTFHPSIMEISFSYSRSFISAAVRVAKNHGLIEVAYKNTDNQPVYRRTTAA